MSETLLYIVIFAALMFFMHRGHGGLGGCGGHSHHGNHEKTSDHQDTSVKHKDSKHIHHH